MRKNTHQNLKKVYTSFNIPFLSHDLVGVNKCFEFVKRKKLQNSI